MRKICLVRLAVAGLLAASAVSCAASRSSVRSSSERSFVSRCVETDCLTRVCDRATWEAVVRQETETFFEPVPAASVAMEVPLSAFDSLPEGVRFAVHEGRLELSAERRGDRLVLGARSDSLARKTLRSSRTETVRRSDTVTVRTTEHRSVAVDSLCCASAVAETAAAPSRFAGRWWFVAGFVLCALFSVRLRR